MRVLAALAALAVMLVWASTAAAALPPPGYHPAFVFQRTAVKSTLKTCTAGAHNQKVKTQKRLVTTACEQPPRANVKDLGGTFWFSP
jgi:hypothetical protein